MANSVMLLPASGYKSTQIPVSPIPLVNTSAFDLSNSDGSCHISGVMTIDQCCCQVCQARLRIAQVWSVLK